MDTCRRKELYKQVRAVIKVFLHISVHIGTHQASALPFALNRKAQERQLPEAPDCHALSLVLGARPLCRTPVSKTKPRGLEPAWNLFTSVLANPELYRWEEARAINFPGSEQKGDHTSHVSSHWESLRVEAGRE